MHHLIKRQIINLTLTTQRGAFELQHRISQLHQAEILSVLQRVLDEISSDEEVIYIDRLEIDLGKLPLKQIMETGWVQLLEAGIRRQLHERLAAKEGEGMIIRRPERSGIFQQWLFSMQHGYLPWNTGRTDEDWYLKVLEAIATDHRIAAELRSVLARDGVVLQRVVQQHSPAFLVPLAESLTAEKQERLAPAIEELWVMVRLLEQEGWPATTVTRRTVIVTAWKKSLQVIAASAVAPGAVVSCRTETLLAELVRAFFSPRQLGAVLRWKDAGLPLLLPVCRQVVEVLRGVSSDDHNPVYFIADIHERESMGIAGRKTSDDPALPLKRDPGATGSLSGQPQVDPPSTGVPQDRKPRTEAPDTTSGSETILSQGAVTPAAGDARPVTAEPPPPAAVGGNQPPVTHTADFSEVIQPRQQDGGSHAHKSFVEAIGGEEIFVGRAGVVLLHPFLHSFFRNLGYVEGGQFRTPELHTRALHLIHYLATGETTAHEHDLLIAKLLCAWPLDAPVDGEIEPTETELVEAGDLLTAAITQWDKVKHTSHTGLREGFLQRSGKLQAKGNDLYLQVETSSIDVLLDYLPWNLSIVKLPWMNNILRVEWR